MIFMKFQILIYLKTIVGSIKTLHGKYRKLTNMISVGVACTFGSLKTLLTHIYILIYHINISIERQTWF